MLPFRNFIKNLQLRGDPGLNTVFPLTELRLETTSLIVPERNGGSWMLANH